MGVDVGATKTQFRTKAPDGRSRDQLLVSNDWRHRPWARDAAPLAALIRDFAGDVPLAAIAIGAHGCDSEAECRALNDLLAAHLPCPVLVRNDAELLVAAASKQPAIGVISGTGSIAVARNPGADLLVAGGWGWILGDEGGAAAILREAARHVCLEQSRTGQSDPILTNRLVQALDVPVTRFGSRIAGLGSGAAIGRFAPAVFEAAAAGSPLALRVIDEAAAALCDLVGWIRDRGAAAHHVITGGGVITTQPRLYTAFIQKMQVRFGPAISCELFTGAPVEGACHLAESLLCSPVRPSSPHPREREIK